MIEGAPDVQREIFHSHDINREWTEKMVEFRSISFWRAKDSQIQRQRLGTWSKVLGGPVCRWKISF
jgi:hypothetical protein